MKLQNIRILSATLLSGCLIALPAHAERVQKFGYVNPERVYTETQAAQRIEATLQKEFGAQQLKQQLTRGNLNSKARKQAEAKLLETGKQYRVSAARLAEEYNLRRNEEFAALQNNANTVIRNLAEKEKYDLIVQEAVFVTREYDITDRVIKLLDEIK